MKEELLGKKNKGLCRNISGGMYICNSTNRAQKRIWSAFMLRAGFARGPGQTLPYGAED